MGRGRVKKARTDKAPFPFFWEGGCVLLRGLVDAGDCGLVQHGAALREG